MVLGLEPPGPSIRIVTALGSGAEPPACPSYHRTVERPGGLGRRMVVAFLGGGAAMLLWWFVAVPVGLRIGVWLTELVAGV